MIEVPEEIVNYFGRSDAPLFWHVPHVIENDMRLGKLIGNIIEQVGEILTSDSEEKPSWLNQIVGYSSEDQKLQAVIYLISNAVAVRRLDILSSDYHKELIRPYDHPDLKEVSPDTEGLVKLDSFDFSPYFFPGLKRGQTIFEILPSIPKATNSMYWTHQWLTKLSTKINTYIRLDPLLINTVTDYSPVFYRMLVYGKPLDWDTLANLREEDHMRWRPDPGWQKDVEFTDLVWSPREDGIHFICEEVPTLNEFQTRGSRYSHGIYVPERHSFTHCDGAIRIYTRDELTDRHQIHVRRTGKLGKRIKIFLFNDEITTDEWTNLTCSFFVWNNDVQNYFGVGIRLNNK